MRLQQLFVKSLPGLVLMSFTAPAYTASAVETKGIRVDGKVIYGDDNRKDYYEEADARLRELSESTVALMKVTSLSPLPGDKFMIKGRTYGTSNNLCKSEPFADQTAAAFCSGFLVAPNLMMTAGHCVTSARDCSDTAFVFGFSYRASGAAPKEVDAREVYRCKNVLHTQAPSGGADFAVIELDRPVLDHKPLTLRASGSVQSGDGLVVMGHPAGIPLKISGGANVRKATSNGYFVANLDTYGGNSGSAVFNSETLEVEGILVRGEQDFSYTSAGCYVSKACSNTGCRGEDVTSIAEAIKKLPQ